MNISKLNLNSQDSTITISARVEQAGSYISGIYIDNNKTFVCTSEPSKLCTKIEPNPETEGVTTGDNGVTELTDYVIDLKECISGVACTIDPKNDLIFVYVAVEAYNSETGEAPTTYHTGVIFDQDSLYKSVFNRVHKSVVSNKNRCCVIPEEASRLSLLFEAFQLSWTTADPKKFIYYWDELHDVPNNVKTCNCNG